jgi:RHS repeat-associated protein
LLRSERCFAQNYKSVVDWSQTVGLESQIFISTTTYDALNRIVTATSPDQSITYRTYNESGRLEQMRVNIQGQVASPDPTTWTSIIKTSDYNARGQVTTVSHGNGVQTTRTYDPQTFRLTRIQSLLAGTTGQTVLQDISYIHDPVGNITSAKDGAQQTIYFRNTVVDASNDYTYDPVYRLITATSREHLGQANQPNIPSSSDSANTRLPQPGDGNAMARYVESYTYDLADNMTKLSHAGSDASVPGWTRNFTYDSSSNHLLSSSVGPSTETYAYDVHGNMIALTSLSSMAWNFLDQLQSTSRQVVNSGTPETTYYSYDILGNRARKVTERAAVAGQTPVKLKERLYIGASEIFRTYGGDGSTVSLERETLSINGEAGREAIIETRTVGDDKSPQQQIRFQFTNFIGSTVLELGMDGGVVSYEEYSPYGDTTYQAVASTLDAPKRYRYSAKERDEESGLYYYGARYYASWLGYWISADPSGVKSGGNQYNFCHDNPIVNFDATGREDLPKEGKLMEAWDYAQKLPKELKAIAHNLQREHPITIELRKWQTGGEYSRNVSAAQHELTVLVETGKGYFHTEVGKLQKVVNGRVRAGLIKFESDLMEETKAIYHQAAAATGAVVNEAELNKVLISNSGTLHTLHGPSGSGAAAAAANPNAAVSTITDESFESAFSEWGEAPKAQVAEPTEAPKVTAAEPQPELPASPASESKLAEVAEVEKGVGAELREASKTVSKTHVFKAAGKAVAVASMLSDAATLVDKKASSDEKVHAGIDLVANGLMESGNSVAEAAGVGLMVGNAAEESLHTSDYSSKWGMEANQYLKSKGFSGDTALAGGAVATVLSTPVALAVSGYDKVRSWF